MRTWLATLVCGVGLLGSSSGCQTTRHDTLSSEVSLRYLPGCAPEVLDQLTVEALGDFPARDDTIVSFDARMGIGSLGSLPVEARLFRIQITTPSYRGAAIAPVTDGNVSPVLVLPPGVACPVPNLAPPALAGTAIAADISGALLIAGGVGASMEASNQIVRLSVEDGTAKLLPRGLFVPRAGACAAPGDRGETWILGGAPSLQAGTLALNSLERIEQATGEVSGLGRLSTPRANARALSLPDGSVLIAGGESSIGAEALRSLERIDPASAEGTTLDAELPWSGTLDALLLRDDGVVVLAGRSAAKAQLALFDPKSEQITSIAAPLTSWDPALTVALPGARLALFEIALDPATGLGETTGDLWILLPDGAQVLVSSWFSSFARLSDARAVALDDGRILLSGTSAGTFSARIVDPGRADVRVRSLAALPSQLLPRSDGSVVALATDAVQVLRENARTPYDNPGGTLLVDDTGDNSVLSLDAPGRFRREGLGLVSTAALARFDITQLRYENARIDVRAKGPSELLLRRADGEQLAIALGTERIGPPFCTLESDPEMPVRIERTSESVLITTSLAQRRCHLDGLEGPIRIAMRAMEPEVRIDLLEVTRVP